MSASDAPGRLSFFLPLAGGGALILLILLAVQHLQPIVEVGWFAHGDETYLDPLAARWVSVLASSLALYGLLSITSRLLDSLITDWLRRFSGFMALSSWFGALQAMIVAEVATGHSGAIWLPHEEQALLTGSLVALLWPVAFGIRLDVRIAGVLFLLNVLSFGVAIVVLEPAVPQAWGVALGFLTPPMDVVLTGRFFEWLPYLVPIGPVLWSTLRLRRQAVS